MTVSETGRGERKLLNFYFFFVIPSIWMRIISLPSLTSKFSGSCQKVWGCENRGKDKRGWEAESVCMCVCALSPLITASLGAGAQQRAEWLLKGTLWQQKPESQSCVECVGSAVRNKQRHNVLEVAAIWSSCLQTQGKKRAQYDPEDGSGRGNTHTIIKTHPLPLRQPPFILHVIPQVPEHGC